MPQQADIARLGDPADAAEDPQTSRRARLWPLLLVLLVAFGLRVGIGFAHPPSDWPDEVFQAREPAHRLVYGYGIVPWEWRSGMRSWVFPAAIAGVMRATSWIAPGSTGYNLGILLALSALSLTVVWVGYEWGYRAGGIPAALITASACAVWYDLIYYDPQALPGIVAAHFLIPGMYFGLFPDSLPVRERTRLWIAGALLGLALALRIHLAPAVLVAAIYCCWGAWKKNTGPLLAGIAIPIFAFGIVDAFTWGTPFASYYNYLHMEFSNITGHAVGPRIAGIRPMGWYLEQLAERLGPAAILMVPAIRRNSSLAAVATAIVASHELIAFKHMYIVAMALPLLVMLMGLGAAAITQAMWKATWHKRPMLAALPGIALIVLASAIWGMANSPWTSESDVLLAFEKVGQRADACGVGFTMHWSLSGGYSYMHRDVPLYPLRYEENPAPPSAYNYIVGPSTSQGFPGYSVRDCAEETCILERAGGCTPAPASEVNAILKSTGH
jgi:GPI mannosyltransferase 3